MLFFCVNNLFLNIISNSTPIYRDKYSILLKEITEVLYNIFLYKSLYLLYLFNKVGPQSRTLQPVRGEGYKLAHKSKANTETHLRLGAGGCHNISKG